MPGETSENHDKAEFWNFSVDLKHLKIHPEYDFRNFDQAQNRNRRKNPKNKEKTAVLPTQKSKSRFSIGKFQSS